MGHKKKSTNLKEFKIQSVFSHHNENEDNEDNWENRDSEFSKQHLRALHCAGRCNGKPSRYLRGGQMVVLELSPEGAKP